MDTEKFVESQRNWEQDFCKPLSVLALETHQFIFWQRTNWTFVDTVTWFVFLRLEENKKKMISFTDS